MDKNEWESFCMDHGGQDSFYQDGDTIYLIEVLENGEWGMHCTAGTIEWALHKLKRLADSDGSRITKHTVN